MKNKLQLTQKQREFIRDYKHHVKMCTSVSCHHDLWAPPPCWFGSDNCRCLQCRIKKFSGRKMWS